MIRTILLATASVACLALSACDYPSLNQAFARAETVRVCYDGTTVVRDPLTERLITVSSGHYDRIYGYAAHGLTADDICEGRKPQALI